MPLYLLLPPFKGIHLQVGEVPVVVPCRCRTMLVGIFVYLNSFVFIATIISKSPHCESILGIVGATGAVGKEIVGCLERRGFDVDQLRIFGT